ncbi:RTA1-domain-containing protein [Cytidiella melzeri]|nr:RTA1-domain-containing protein [Cytidiella melzeri]
MAANITSKYNASATDHFGGSPYHYVPTEWICALFIALFALSGLLHLGQGIYTRLWFMLPTAVLANISEVIGWGGRLWSSKNPTLLDPFLMQITTTIIAPTPLVAANFVILGEVIRRMGPQYSRLSAMWYTIVFCSCDIIALVIQAVGGASASRAVHQGTNPNHGGNIMLAGIAFQLAAITIYVALAVEFVIRYYCDRPVRKAASNKIAQRYLEKNTKLMLLGLGFSSLFIFIRSIYRTIELQNGWDGRIISTQVLFNVLDGAMIVLATFTLNLFHPGFLLGNGRSWYMNGNSSFNDSHSNTTVEDGQETAQRAKTSTAA